MVDAADISMDFVEDPIQPTVFIAHTGIASGISSPVTNGPLTQDLLQGTSPVESSRGQYHLRELNTNPVTIKSQYEDFPIGSKSNATTTHSHNEEPPSRTAYGPLDIITPQMLHGPDKYTPESRKHHLDFAKMVEIFQSTSRTTGSNSLTRESQQKPLSDGKSPQANFFENPKQISTSMPAPKMLQAPSSSNNEALSTSSRKDSSGSSSVTPKPGPPAAPRPFQSSTPIMRGRPYSEFSASAMVSKITPAISQFKIDN